MTAQRSKPGVSLLGDASAWVSLAAFLAMVIAENLMEAMNPNGNGPWPEGFPRPTRFTWLLSLRNISLPVALLAVLIALPRRKAIASLLLTVLYATYVYWVFVHY